VVFHQNFTLIRRLGFDPVLAFMEPAGYTRSQRPLSNAVLEWPTRLREHATPFELHIFLFIYTQIIPWVSQMGSLLELLWLKCYVPAFAMCTTCPANIILLDLISLKHQEKYESHVFVSSHFANFLHFTLCYSSLTNSVALVRERTIPTERPPLVGEVSANFCG
jgi:hypothetical protein